MSRVNELFDSIPLCTVGLLSLNIGLHVILFLTSFPIHQLAISAPSVIKHVELYRLFSAAFVHAGILHIGMNMMSLLQLGSSLETQFGSMQFFFLTLWSVPITNFLYVLVDGFIFHSNASGVGFSGILFTYALLESYHTTVPTRSVFGFFNVPSKLYPWVLLIAISLIMPGVSFLGHLCGILVGMLTVSGYMMIFLPSKELYQECDDSRWLVSVTRRGNYVRAVERSFTSSDASGRSLSSLTGPVVYILTMALNVFKTILYIFGIPIDGIFLAIYSYMQRGCVNITGMWASLTSRLPTRYHAVPEGEAASVGSVARPSREEGELESGTTKAIQL